jgi:hypothetical protein
MSGSVEKQTRRVGRHARSPRHRQATPDWGHRWGRGRHCPSGMQGRSSEVLGIKEAPVRMQSQPAVERAREGSEGSALSARVGSGRSIIIYVQDHIFLLLPSSVQGKAGKRSASCCKLSFPNGCESLSSAGIVHPRPQYSSNLRTGSKVLISQAQTFINRPRTFYFFLYGELYINCTDKHSFRSFRNGHLFRCLFKRQMHSVLLVADRQLSLTGCPEMHARQGMANKSRQRDLDTVSIGSSGDNRRPNAG